LEVERDAGPVPGVGTAVIGRPSRGPAALSLDNLVAHIAPGAGLKANGTPAFTLSIRRGKWTPPPMLRESGLLLLVLSGCLLRRRAGDSSLFIARDLGHVGAETDERWRALSSRPVVVAVLNAPTIATLARVPGVAEALLQAFRGQHEREVELRSIVGTYDVRERIVRFFGHLARHVGQPEGPVTRIPLLLEQKRIEEILAAGHTQATTAFRSLVRSGALTHDSDGWLFDASGVTPGGAAISHNGEFGAELVSRGSASDALRQSAGAA
jgi:hypothetical protein